MNALVLHGMPSRAEYEDPAQPAPPRAHWLPWIAERLRERGVDVAVPELPVPYAPDYAAWSAAFERFSLDPGTLLIGHSCGAGFLVRYLSEHPVRARQLVLVAPYLDPRGTIAPFFDFVLDAGLAERVPRIDLFVSDDDDPDITGSAELVRRALPVRLHRFADKGHFTRDDLGTVGFPELLAALDLSSP